MDLVENELGERRRSEGEVKEGLVGNNSLNPVIGFKLRIKKR